MSRSTTATNSTPTGTAKPDGRGILYRARATMAAALSDKTIISFTAPQVLALCATLFGAGVGGAAWIRNEIKAEVTAFQAAHEKMLDNRFGYYVSLERYRTDQAQTQAAVAKIESSVSGIKDILLSNAYRPKDGGAQ